jgi:hypothetical protein
VTPRNRTRWHCALRPSAVARVRRKHPGQASICVAAGPAGRAAILWEEGHPGCRRRDGCNGTPIPSVAGQRRRAGCSPPCPRGPSPPPSPTPRRRAGRARCAARDGASSQSPSAASAGSSRSLPVQRSSRLSGSALSIGARARSLVRRTHGRTGRHLAYQAGSGARAGARRGAPADPVDAVPRLRGRVGRPPGRPTG